MRALWVFYKDNTDICFILPSLNFYDKICPYYMKIMNISIVYLTGLPMVYIYWVRILAIPSKIIYTQKMNGIYNTN